MKINPNTRTAIIIIGIAIGVIVLPFVLTPPLLVVAGVIGCAIFLLEVKQFRKEKQQAITVPKNTLRDEQ